MIAPTHDLANVRALAAEKGYLAERAHVRDCWRLIDEATGEYVRRKSGTTVFTLAQAIQFLKAAPRER